MRDRALSQYPPRPGRSLATASPCAERNGFGRTSLSLPLGFGHYEPTPAMISATGSHGGLQLLLERMDTLISYPEGRDALGIHES